MVTEAPAAPRGAYPIFHSLMIAVVIAAVAAGAVAIGFGVRAHFRGDPRVSHVRLISDGSSIPGASSTLTRSDKDASFTLRTSGLPRDHIVTLRALIFNDPERCTHGTRARRCGEEDLGDPAAGGSVILAGATWLRNASAITFSGKLSKENPGKLTIGGGLTNPRDAEIDFVILDHGPPISGRFSEMLQTFRGGCTDPQGSEKPGPNACADIQFSPHEAR